VGAALRDAEGASGPPNLGLASLASAFRARQVLTGLLAAHELLGEPRALPLALGMGGYVFGRSASVFVCTFLSYATSRIYGVLLSALPSCQASAWARRGTRVWAELLDYEVGFLSESCAPHIRKVGAPY
jgi:hypothetical protein